LLFAKLGCGHFVTKIYSLISVATTINFLLLPQAAFSAYAYCQEDAKTNKEGFIAFLVCFM